MIEDEGLALKRIEALLSERADAYGFVTARSFASRHSIDDRWQNIATRFDVLAKNDPAPDAVNWDFGESIFSLGVLSTGQLRTIVRNLVNERRLILPGMPDIAYEGQFRWREFRPSNRRGPLRLPWPSDHYLFQPNSSINFPGGPLVALGAPAFVDVLALISSQFDMDVRGAGAGSIHVLLPQYLARLKAVTIGPTRLSISVETRTIPLEGLLAKIHLIDEQSQQSRHEELLFETDAQAIGLGFSPTRAYVGLLSKEFGETLDYREFHVNQVGLPRGSDDVQRELLAEEEIETLILQGENSQVEFKGSLREAVDLAETIVAFANSIGGVILVGVDNRGHVTGYREEDPENTIRNIIREYCEPTVEATVEATSVHGKPLVALRVSEGMDKPYTLRGRGVIVRYGATDRAATRHEIDAFYLERKDLDRGIFGR
ncbi:MAG TPA: ATP-binding protein [Nitrospiraceae bacterium]|nr:ATP-binding protein [Nitrospiraceae bacterium]